MAPGCAAATPTTQGATVSSRLTITARTTALVLTLGLGLAACKKSEAPAPGTGSEPPAQQERAAQEVTLYTTREPGLIQPLLDAFTQDTGVKVNTVFVKDGLPERLRAEGTRSPADVLMTVDTGNLLDLVQAGLTQPVQSEVLTSAIPGNLRGEDGHWFALSLRDRILYVRKDLDLQTFAYEDLADPKWKDRVCIRSGQH